MALGPGMLRAEPGMVVPYVPAAPVAVNSMVLEGNKVGFLCGGARPGSTVVAAGDVGALLLAGVIEYPLKSGDADAAGALLYFDDSNNWMTVTAGALKKAGVSLFGSLPWTPLSGNCVFALSQAL